MTPLRRFSFNLTKSNNEFIALCVNHFLRKILKRKRVKFFSNSDHV